MVSQPRPATDRDLVVLCNLWLEFMDHHAGLDPSLARRRGAEVAWMSRIRSVLNDPRHLMLVIDDEHETVGFLKAIIQDYPPIFEETQLGVVQEIVVTADRRRRGHGTRLYRAAEQWFQQQGVARIEACIDTRNHETRLFWASLGYHRDSETLLKRVPAPRAADRTA